MHSVPAFTNGNNYNYLCVINGKLTELWLTKSNTIYNYFTNEHI